MTNYAAPGSFNVSTTKEPRRMVQIAAVEDSESAYPMLVGLCNDGSVWMTWKEPRNWHAWEQLPEIPQ